MGSWSGGIDSSNYPKCYRKEVTIHLRLEVGDSKGLKKGIGTPVNPGAEENTFSQSVYMERQSRPLAWLVNGRFLIRGLETLFCHAPLNSTEVESFTNWW